jgi:hypothetical protein
MSGKPECAQAVPDMHGPMNSTAAMVESLVTMEGDDLPVRGADRPKMPWVGWDIEEVVAADTEIEIGAEVHHGTEGPQDVVGSSASVVVSGFQPSLSIPMSRGEKGWLVVLPPLPMGIYQLNVEVKGAWYGASVYASTPFAVVHAEEAQP